jgi:hypothetical protein
MSSPEPLQHDHFYHIYNQGINGEPLFREERNYQYFLKLWARYIEPIAETYAYCLLSNHFHFLIRIKEDETGDETGPILEIGPVLGGEQDQTGGCPKASWQRVAGQLAT